MSFFATEYTIHFDDTMAYGSHHFLTAFKFQCASREAFLFGERVFDRPGVKEALEGVHLFTADAYARNLNPARLGDRVAILLTLEDWGRVSARFCYRVINENGQSICAGYQTLICADPATQAPTPLPAPLRQAMDAMREIEEPHAAESFRDRVLAGGRKLDSLFGETEREAVRRYLSQRYPSPVVLNTTAIDSRPEATAKSDIAPDTIPTVADPLEAWVFAGQAAFDSKLLAERLQTFRQQDPTSALELETCAEIVKGLFQEQFQQGAEDVTALFSGSPSDCEAAVNSSPVLSQIAIHLQNVIGARLWQAEGHRPSVLMGHSFGEIAALSVSGCFDLATGIRIVCLRIRVLDEHAPVDGGLLVVGTDRRLPELEAEMLGLDDIVVAGINHESQTVLSGPSDQLAQLQQRLQSQGTSASQIASSTSFHHPHLKAAAEQWLSELRQLPLSPPAIPVYSPVDGRMLETTDDLPLLLSNHLVKPFDFQAGISHVTQSGITLLVDCGSAGMLARLIAKTSSSIGTVTCVNGNLLGETEKATPNDLAMIAKFEHRGQPHKTIIKTVEAFASENNRKAEVATNKPRVAIVGQGCILPGRVRSPEELYSAIAQQRVGIVDQRLFDPHWTEDFYSEKLTPDRSNSHLSGLVADDDIAPPPGIDTNLFRRFTRTQRLLCIALAPCLNSLKDAKRVICLLGATADGFEDQDKVSSLRLAGIDPCDPKVDERMLTARSAFQDPHSAVQEVFDHLVRPGLEVTLVDAACASSLYTLALGMQALETGKADAVIAGGFFCPGPGNSCLFSQFRGTTSTGCRPFDAGADGVVFSEGAALVTLRRLSDAERLGLNIHATVLGTGLSSDGRSSSANVPQSKGQLLSLERCYANYGIDPSSIDAIEGHGTSTPVGDSTEIETLRQFFVGRTAKPIPVHSLKGLLGHAGWAAGTASVIAACHYMRHGVFPQQAFHRESSAALKKADGTLTVTTSPQALPKDDCRIAIDGFGFGGANAHMVVEKYRFKNDIAAIDATPTMAKNDRGNDLVFVGFHDEQTSTASLTFDRQNTQLPRGQLVLPELKDDMDITQTLAVIVTERVVSQIENFNDDLRRETSLVLALSGKSERGIEATLRIMAKRFQRQLNGIESARGLIEKAYDRARPSGTYTLQCMMPNVAPGRAALLLNLNGPNFVVDAGASSLQAAISSAELLLRSGDKAGTRLAIVAAIEAASNSLPHRPNSESKPEFATAFALTTRLFAEERSLKILAGVDETLAKASKGTAAGGTHPSVFEHVQAVIAALREVANPHTAPSSPVVPVTSLVVPNVAQLDTKKKQAVAALRAPIKGSKRHVDPTPNEHSGNSDDSACKIYGPVWLEKPISQTGERVGSQKVKRLVVLVPDTFGAMDKLGDHLSEIASEVMLAVVKAPSSQRHSIAGEAAFPAISGVDSIRVDLLDANSTSRALQQIEDFGAEFVIALDAIRSWNGAEVLESVATDNGLAELLFLAAQRHSTRLKSGSIEFWGLLLDAWNDEVHPRSGAIAGLLKSIQREYPAARTSTICTRGLSLQIALRRLLQEKRQPENEQEIVLDGKLRRVRRLRPSLIDSQAASDARQPQGEGSGLPSIVLGPASVVVATGGAKGVTAVMLEAILQDSGCQVIVLGRSKLEAGPENFDGPDVEKTTYRRLMLENPTASPIDLKKRFEAMRAAWEAHQTIESLNASGGRVDYRVADVTDRVRMERVIAQVVSRYGRIDLLIHGACVQHSKRLVDRTLEDFRQTYAIKVNGLRNLVECSSEQLGRQIPTHVLTSAYSVFGNDGQHDYGAANETLDRLCTLMAVDTGCHWSSIAWLAWDGIGMTRGSEYRALAKKRRLSGVDPRLGQRLFRDVISGKTASAINVPMTAAEHVEYSIKTVPPNRNRTKGRMLEVDVQLSSIECLPFHRIRNTPTLPGAWILDLFVGAAQRLVPATTLFKNLTLQNVSFSRFVRLANNLEPNVRIVAEENADTIRVWMVADLLHPSGVVLSKDVVCASAEIALTDAGGPRQFADRLASGQTSTQAVRQDPYCQGQREVDLSGLFDCLSNIQIGDQNRRASFTPSLSAGSTGDIPALLVDAAWRVGAMYAASGKNDVYVPVKIGKLILPLGSSEATVSGSTWEIRSTAPKPENRNVRWDRTEVFDQAGRLKLVVEDAWATQLL